MSKQEVILCESLETSLGRAIELCPHDKLFVLTDEHTQRQHAAEEQDDERGARQPPPRGQGQQHGQRARHHGGVQRGVERAVQRRAENGVRRPFRQKAGFARRK